MSKINSEKKSSSEIKKHIVEDSTGDTDLFNFLRQMHLTGGANGITVTYRDPAAFNNVSSDPLAPPDQTTTQILASRKRKAWEGIHSGNNKWVGGQRPPALRSAESDEDHLQTPNHSNTGYEDEEETGEHGSEDDKVDGDVNDGRLSGGGGRAWDDEEVDQVQEEGKHHQLLSPGTILNCEDIDADNLAADFDGSFTGLGVDINTANYSMSEAMMTLNNIAVQQHVKEEHGTSSTSNKLISVSLKSEPQFMFSNYGALDLSNDDAQHPDSENSSSPQNRDPPTFSGSVSRENSQEAAVVTLPGPGPGHTVHQQKRASNIVKAGNIVKNPSNCDPGQFRLPSNNQQSVILSYTKHDTRSVSSSGWQHQDGFWMDKILSRQSQPPPQNSYSSTHQYHQDVGDASLPTVQQGYRIVPNINVTTKSEGGTRQAGPPDQTEETDGESRFQYILAAPTSILTKPGDPSLTYINQGQSYEIKIKKLGDISGHYKKKWLRSTIRICFHERRLQYIETEQIAEWSRSHPNERILEIDMPLSYGIADVKQDSSNLSCVSFLWDPTRDTGIFIKVHCISTEFTPKKHGGERGVPFRLQIETFSSEVANSRLHAGACILQVFKLKGADRKHKQDRDKISKRPDAVKDKYSPQYECTVLSDLSVDNIYIPNSEGVSPIQSDVEINTNSTSAPGFPRISMASSGSSSSQNVISGGSVSAKCVHNSHTSISKSSSREESPLKTTVCQSGLGTMVSTGPPPGDNKTWKIVLPSNATWETTSGWLAYNRYGSHIKTFTNFDARDMLRLTKEELVKMIGLADGVRLFNDLHLKPISPRLTLYLAKKGESLFHPLLLQDVTVQELIRSISDLLETTASRPVENVVIQGPNKINVKLTDEYLRNQPYDSAFYFHIQEDGDSQTIKLESAGS